MILRRRFPDLHKGNAQSLNEIYRRSFKLTLTAINIGIGYRQCNLQIVTDIYESRPFKVLKKTSESNYKLLKSTQK